MPGCSTRPATWSNSTSGAGDAKKFSLTNPFVRATIVLITEQRSPSFSLYVLPLHQRVFYSVLRFLINLLAARPLPSRENKSAASLFIGLSIPTVHFMIHPYRAVKRQNKLIKQELLVIKRFLKCGSPHEISLSCILTAQKHLKTRALSSKNRVLRALCPNPQPVV